MNEPFSEELLSAYVDGELSATERAEVERWLEQHPAARDQVEDFRRLSQMFGNLSRTEVPLEFRIEVLQRAERRMLLPDPAAPRKPGGRRGWLLALAAPLAAAAVLVLTVQILDRGAVKQGELAGVDNGRAASPAAVRTFHKDRVVAEQLDTPFSDLESNSNTDGTVAAPANPQLAAIDEAVQRIIESRAEDKVVSVVKVYVADRANGLVLMQRVLEENNISVEPGDHPVPAKPDVLPVDDRSRNDALYIVAEPEELLAFADMLIRRHPDLRIDVEAPVALAMLDDTSRKQLQAVEKEFDLGKERRDNADAQGAPAPTAAARPAGSKPGTISGKTPAEFRATQAEQGLESAISQKGASDPKENADKSGSQKKLAGGQTKDEPWPDVPSGPAAKAQADRPKTANQSKSLDQQRYSTQSRNPQQNSARRAEPAEGDANRQMNNYSNSRQAVVNLSPTFENRQRAALSKRDANYDQPAEKSRAPAPRPTPADDVSAADAKTSVEEKLQQPALVRMLIVIEPEER